MRALETTMNGYTKEQSINTPEWGMTEGKEPYESNYILCTFWPWPPEFCVPFGRGHRNYHRLAVRCGEILTSRPLMGLRTIVKAQESLWP